MKALELLIQHWQGEEQRFREEAAAKNCEKCLVAAEAYASCIADAQVVLDELRAIDEQQKARVPA